MSREFWLRLLGDQAVYFCLSGLAAYDYLPPLPEVVDEIRLMRRTFARLGMTELFPVDGLRDHQSLHTQLQQWKPDRPADEITLVIYSTGHGLKSADSRKWILADTDASEDNPRKSLEPQQILQAVHGVNRILLVLDACFAGLGADEAFPLVRRTLQEEEMPIAATDLCILSAAQRLVPARPNALAPALAAALLADVQPSLNRPFLSMGNIEASLQEAFAGSEQVPQIVRGKQVGSRMLPNPGYMPPLPERWNRFPMLGVSAPARGLSDRRERGWFFTGRDLALAELWEYVHTVPEERRPPYLLTGPSGSGASAILARMVTTATDADRAELPLVTRPAAEVADDVAVSTSELRRPDHRGGGRYDRLVRGTPAAT